MFLYISRQLGSDDKYTDKDTKLRLLNFSLCYCPIEEIQVTLKEKRILQAKVQLHVRFSNSLPLG